MYFYTLSVNEKCLNNFSIYFFPDTSVDIFSQRIADRIAENCGKAAILTFDNKRLTINENQRLETPALLGMSSSMIKN